MSQTFEAIYENGLLRPLAPLNVADQERVQVTIRQSSDGRGDDDWLDQEALAMARRELPATISLEELRQRLSRVPGNWADDIIADRGDY